MKWRYAVYVLLVGMALGAGYGLLGLRQAVSPDAVFVAVGKTPPHLPALQNPRAHLYFAAHTNAFLTAEERALGNPSNPTAFGEQIINALIEGPRGELVPTFPPQTALRGLYVGNDKTAYVDLSSAVSDFFPGGAQSELLTVYSVVNSLVLNVPQIEAVKILIEGDDTATLAGHIELRLPLKAHMLLIR